MSKFRKIAWIVLIIEMLLIIACNLLCFYQMNRKDGRTYRVEAKRVLDEIKEQSDLSKPGDVKAENANIGLELIDLSQYSSIVSVSVYDAEKIIYNDYIVEEVNGTLYCIEYIEADNYAFMVYMNISFAILFVLSAVIFTYVQIKIIKPFANMQHLSEELAKGNLSVPIKEEKSKFFGRFLWGMDMLRESLEDKKRKELELQKEKKTLILSLSHDIKTPLSAIELYTKALEEGLYDTKEKQDEALKGIKKNAEEIKSYVNEITKASREDFLNLEVHNGELYLSEVLDVTKAYYTEKLAVLHTEFLVEDVSNCLIRGDKDRIVEVLQNVMENAIKYGDGNKISISFDDEEDCKLLTVSNTGVLPDENELPHLFDSFYRGSNASNINGSGLGLYICKNLMKKMDGDIFVKADAGQFAVTIVIRKS